MGEAREEVEEEREGGREGMRIPRTSTLMWSVERPEGRERRDWTDFQMWAQRMSLEETKVGEGLRGREGPRGGGEGEEEGRRSGRRMREGKEGERGRKGGARTCPGYR